MRLDYHLSCGGIKDGIGCGSISHRALKHCKMGAGNECKSGFLQNEMPHMTHLYYQHKKYARNVQIPGVPNLIQTKFLNLLRENQNYKHDCMLWNLELNFSFFQRNFHTRTYQVAQKQWEELPECVDKNQMSFPSQSVKDL